MALVVIEDKAGSSGVILNPAEEGREQLKVERLWGKERVPIEGAKCL